MDLSFNLRTHIPPDPVTVKEPKSILLARPVLIRAAGKVTPVKVQFRRVVPSPARHTLPSASFRSPSLPSLFNPRETSSLDSRTRYNRLVLGHFALVHCRDPHCCRLRPPSLSIAFSPVR